MFTWTTQFVVDRFFVFQSSVCVIVFHFVSGKLEKECSAAPMCAEQSNKRDHEFAAKIVKILMSVARKKMREDLADKAEIHAFRCLMSSVSIALFHSQQLHKFAHQAWSFVEFISISIWV